MKSRSRSCYEEQPTALRWATIRRPAARPGRPPRPGRSLRNAAMIAARADTRGGKAAKRRAHATSDAWARRTERRAIARVAGRLCPPYALRLAMTSADDREQPRPADGPRPVPDVPGRLAAFEREEDDAGVADQQVGCDVADVGKAAVLGIIAIVAHHEVMAGRHRVDVRVVGVERVGTRGPLQRGVAA